MRLYLIAFCCGIWWLQWQPGLPDTRWVWGVLPAALVLMVARAQAGWLDVSRRVLAACLCAALGVAWATWRAETRLAGQLPDDWQGVDIELVGVVSDLPYVDERAEHIQLEVERVATPGAPPLQRVLLARYFPRGEAHEPRFRAGERWRLTARLKRPWGTHNPAGFDFEAWALQRGIAATGSVRGEPVLIDARAATPLARIAVARAAVRDRILATLAGDPGAGAVAALAVGDRRALTNAEWRAWTRTGTNHLLSISGLHVGLVAAFAGGVFAFGWRRVPRLTERIPARQAGFVAAVVAAAGYAALAGFAIPTQRTLIMLVVLAVAFWGRREPRPFTALVWALAVVLAIDPWAVLAPGFWLSFGALATLVWVAFGRAALSARWHGWVAAQAALTLALAPALMLLFQQVSLVSPLANAVAIPVVSVIVTPLALAGIVVPPLWHVAALVVDTLAAGLHWAAALPWATFSRPAPPAWAVALALAGAVWLLLPRGFPLRVLGALLWLPLLFPRVAPLANGAFTADVIDVGQGTSILIRTAGHALLYDTGPGFGDSDAGERTVVPFLRAAGVGRLDGVIASHDDNDHTGGLRSVLRDVPTGWLLHGLPDDSALLHGAPAPRRCVRGLAWRWSGVGFAVLNPQADAWDERRRRDNDFSCVLRVVSPHGTLLITGDAERRGELELLESGASLKSDAIIAGHHGSKTSSIPDFVDAVAAKEVVFTVGYRNRYHHPHPAVVARWQDAGARSWRSDCAGAVTLAFGEAGVVASEYRANHRRYWQAPSCP